MFYYGLEWDSLDTYMQFREVPTTPSIPQSDEIRQYAFDSGGISTMCWINDAGNITCLPTGGGTIPTGSGTPNAVVIWTSPTTIGDDPTQLFWNNANNTLQIGTETATHYGADTGIVIDRTGSSALIAAEAHSATVTHAGNLNLSRSRGTHASPTIVAADDRLARFVSQGYDGDTYIDAAAIDVYVDGTPGDNDMPGRIAFFTTPNGSTVLTERIRIAETGKFLIGGTWGTHTGTDGYVSIDTDGAGAILEINTHNAGNQSSIFGQRSRGTHASPTIVSDGDTALHILAKAYGNALHDMARISFQVDGTPGSGDMPGRIVFFTTPDGSATLGEKARIHNSNTVDGQTILTVQRRDGGADALQRVLWKAFSTLAAGDKVLILAG